ncbi:MAG: hypothetical protein WBC93_01890, partial [Sulfitobacter sp.]
MITVEEKKQNVPKLRFPEFGGTWETGTINSLNFQISDGNYGELYPKVDQFSGTGVPFIRANNLKDGRVTWADMRFIPADLHSILISGHLEEDDVLVTTRGDIGIVSIVGHEFSGANIN